MNIVTSIHEGFYNAPKLYGSEVRGKGDITNFKSGLQEAGKVLSAGLLTRLTLMAMVGPLLWVLRWYYWLGSGTDGGRKKRGVFSFSAFMYLTTPAVPSRDLWVL